MPVLYLIRHGEAEPRAGGGDDARHLSREGRRRFGDLWRAIVPEPPIARVLSSPAARALETAAIVAAAAGAVVEEEAALAPGRSSGREILELGRSRGAGTALVGHNPEMAEAIALAAGSEEHVPAGSVAAVEAEPTGWRLLWMRSP